MSFASFSSFCTFWNLLVALILPFLFYFVDKFWNPWQYPSQYPPLHHIHNLKLHRLTVTFIVRVIKVIVFIRLDFKLSKLVALCLARYKFTKPTPFLNWGLGWGAYSTFHAWSGTHFYLCRCSGCTCNLGCAHLNWLSGSCTLVLPACVCSNICYRPLRCFLHWDLRLRHRYCWWTLFELSHLRFSYLSRWAFCVHIYEISWDLISYSKCKLKLLEL